MPAGAAAGEERSAAGTVASRLGVVASQGVVEAESKTSRAQYRLGLERVEDCVASLSSAVSSSLGEVPAFELVRVSKVVPESQRRCVTSFCWLPKRLTACDGIERDLRISLAGPRDQSLVWWSW